MIERILYLSQVDLAATDGPGTNEFEFTGLLARNFGKRAWAVVPEPSGPVEHFTDMNVIHYDIPHLAQGLGFFVSAYRVAKNVASVVREHDIDLVATRPGHLPIIPWMLQRFFGVPVAIKQIGWWRIRDKTGTVKDWAARMLHWYLYHGLMHRAVAIDAITDEWYERTRTYLGSDDKLVFVINGANVHRFKPSPEKPRRADVDVSDAFPVLGFVGTLPSVRGARQMVETLQALKSDYPKAAAVVVGDDDDMAAIRELAEQYGVLARCHFLGFKPYGDVPELINTFDVGFSFFDPWKLDQTGNASQKVRQYLACGKPVVSVRAGHDFLVENGLGGVADTDDYEAIAQVTKSIAENLQVDSAAVRQRCRDYAVAYMSIDAGLKTRLAFWERMLKKEVAQN